MKTKTLVFLALLAIPPVHAHGDHDKETKEQHAAHDDHDKVKKGPNGGQVITSREGFSFEVAVDKNRKARVVFLDKEGKAKPLEKQSVSGVAGPRSAPVKLVFAAGGEADANVLVSDNALPEGAHVALILVIKTTPEAKPVTERFELHLH